MTKLPQIRASKNSLICPNKPVVSEQVDINSTRMGTTAGYGANSSFNFNSLSPNAKRNSGFGVQTNNRSLSKSKVKW